MGTHHGIAVSVGIPSTCGATSEARLPSWPVTAALLANHVHTQGTFHPATHEDMAGEVAAVLQGCARSWLGWMKSFTSREPTPKVARPAGTFVLRCRRRVGGENLLRHRIQRLSRREPAPVHRVRRGGRARVLSRTSPTGSSHDGRGRLRAGHRVSASSIAFPVVK